MQYKGLLELCYKGRYFDMKVLSAERDVRYAVCAKLRESMSDRSLFAIFV